MGVRRTTGARTYRRNVQSPSSLIFLVLLGVWAAYFVQYWVRRRDHVATARSVEQFTEAMRVLERRDPLPRTDLSEPAPRSYAVHPARASRPQVLVKRAVATEPGPIGVTERIDDGSDAVAPVAASARAAGPGARSTASVTSPRPVRRPTRAPAAPRRVRPSRRVRGLLLLGALAELLVIAPLVAAAMLPLWALAPATLAVVWAFLFVRSGVRAERRVAVRSQARRQSDLARRRASAPSQAASAARPAASADTAAAAVEADESVEVATSAEPDVAAEVEPTVVDPAVAEVAEVVEVADDVMVPIVDEDDIPLTWDPVPVPRPTYTMKAKAQRAHVAPAAVTPDPAPVVRESDESQYDERRVAGA
jgi:hypothetical protein